MDEDPAAPPLPVAVAARRMADVDMDWLVWDDEARLSAADARLDPIAQIVYGAVATSLAAVGHDVQTCFADCGGVAAGPWRATRSNVVPVVAEGVGGVVRAVAHGGGVVILAAADGGGGVVLAVVAGGGVVVLTVADGVGVAVLAVANGGACDAATIDIGDLGEDIHVVTTSSAARARLDDSAQVVYDDEATSSAAVGNDVQTRSADCGGFAAGPLRALQIIELLVVTDGGEDVDLAVVDAAGDVFLAVVDDHDHAGFHDATTSSAADSEHAVQT